MIISLYQKFRRRLLIFKCRVGCLVRGGKIDGLRYVNLAAPLVVDGRGEVQLAPRSSFGYHEAPMIGNGAIRLQARLATSKITIGEGCAFSNNISVCAIDSIHIGSQCLIGDMVLIIDADHHELDPSKRWDGPGTVRPVVVGNNVWIGSRATILRGVCIGDNSVIGAGAVVTKSVPPNVVVAGNPARIIKTL